MDRPIAVGRELTKAYEELVVWPIVQHLEYFTSPKGEFTILVPPAVPEAGIEKLPPSPAALRLELGQLTNIDGSTRRRALKVLADRHGVSVNELYKLLGGSTDEG